MNQVENFKIKKKKTPLDDINNDNYAGTKKLCWKRRLTISWILDKVQWTIFMSLTAKQNSYDFTMCVHYLLVEI